MKDTIIGKKVNDAAIDTLIDLLEANADADSIFYAGYPIVPNIEASITIPALLISKQFGLVCFDIEAAASIQNIDKYRERQKKISIAMKSKLLNYENLCNEDDLAFQVNVITFSMGAVDATLENDLFSRKITTSNNLKEMLSTCRPFESAYFEKICSAIERVANIKPKLKREIAITPNSKGAILKQIESEIANLDSWQKHAAIETPNSPQRIRGLAGTGKTIVLALKAAYLHGEHSDWKIGVTFYTRTLKQQFYKLIRVFYFEDYKTDINTDNLMVLHGFGSFNETGVYYEICQAYGVPPRNFDYAKNVYGYNNAFKGVCGELLQIVQKEPKEIFDALLIDEAQDMPVEFLRLAYLTTKNHRIIWAYDDLQNLGDYQISSLEETFGVNSYGVPNVRLLNDAKQPRQDIPLSKCYRNPPWILITAHALGMGIYKEGGLIQHPKNPKIWTEIGYEVESGELELGSSVVLKRSEESTPSFFAELLSQDDTVCFNHYKNDHEQYVDVARMIEENLRSEEVYPQDIAVVIPDYYLAEEIGLTFKNYLTSRNIDCHIVGITSSRDMFAINDSVAISGPYRAKGNEAPIIYVIGAEYCTYGKDLVKRRNILFTSITRAKGWVRVCGVGEGMKLLVNEFKTLKNKQFMLDYKIPTEAELAKMRVIYGELSPEDRKRVEKIERFANELPSNLEDLTRVFESLPPEVKSKLKNLLSNL